MRASTKLTFEGETKTIKEWALDYGITPRLIIARLREGASVADAITTPMPVKGNTQRLPIFHRAQGDAATQSSSLGRKGRRLTYKGETLSVPEWARRLNISVQTLNYRLRSGWALNDVFSPRRRQPCPVVRAVSGRQVAHRGMSLTVAQWSVQTGIPVDLINYRLRNGWLVSDALDIPPQKRRPATRGVGKNLSPIEGTDAGRPLQETPKITFSKEAITE